MARFFSKGALVVVTLIWSMAVVAQSSRWQVEIGHGGMDVPPTYLDRDYFSYIFERAIPDIKSGGQNWLGMRWNLDQNWYLSGRYERLKLSYHNPLSLSCPRVVFVAFSDSCPEFFEISLPRDGFIEDRVHHGRLAVGRRLPVTPWLAGFVELGYGRMQWRSDDDIEAAASADCQAFLQAGTWPEDYYASLVDVPGCRRVGRNASSDGVVAVVGLDLELPARFAVNLAWHHQDYRHVIYRNQKLAEFEDANPALCGPRPCTQALLYPRQPQGSWNWLQARVSHDFTDHIGLFVEMQAGGSRDWNVYSGGLRFSF